MSSVKTGNSEAKCISELTRKRYMKKVNTINSVNIDFLFLFLLLIFFFIRRQRCNAKKK